MNDVQHEIVTDAQGVVRVDGAVEDLEVAIAWFKAEAAAHGSPVLVRTTDQSSPPLLFEVDADGTMTPVDEQLHEATVDEIPVGVAEEEAPLVDVDEQSELTPPAPTPALEVGHPLEEAFGPTSPITDPAPARRALLTRRSVLVAVGIVAAIAVGGGAAWWVSSAVAEAPAAQPTPVSSTAAPAVVTLPGRSTKPAWTQAHVDAAAAFGGHVIGLTGNKVTLWDAGTGKPAGQATLTGTGGRVLAGDVDQFAALAAVSDTQALVWVDGEPVPPIDLTGGRTLETRSGAFFVTGPDRTFWLVTKTGEVPLTAPGAQLIVLSGAADRILWATGAGHVVAASPNGTVLADATLVPPAAGAKVTPQAGWLRVTTPTVAVIGWTLPDGQTVTGIHNTTTGALIGTIPGAGKGLLQPNRTEWVTDGTRVSLVDGKTTPLPAGFIPSAYLGGDLLGAMTDGGDALLKAGEATPTPIPASTVRPVATADPKTGTTVLVTLTAGQLAVYPPIKTNR